MSHNPIPLFVNVKWIRTAGFQSELFGLNIGNGIQKGRNINKADACVFLLYYKRLKGQKSSDLAVLSPRRTADGNDFKYLEAPIESTGH